MHEKEQFLNDWQGGDCKTLVDRFGLKKGALDDIEILLASYNRDAFCGEAFVLFRQGDMLYEVNASHNSSDGIEGQWDPEETLIIALRYRMERGRLGHHQDEGGLFADELAFLLAELEAEGYR
ncbi:MAG: hypothetical protein ROD09_04300 [Candidatus Sedimenticola sp. (ex Thyasira tokunagai)]